MISIPASFGVRVKSKSINYVDNRFLEFPPPNQYLKSALIVICGSRITAFCSMWFLISSKMGSHLFKPLLKKNKSNQIFKPLKFRVHPNKQLPTSILNFHLICSLSWGFSLKKPQWVFWIQDDKEIGNFVLSLQNCWKSLKKTLQQKAQTQAPCITPKSQYQWT